MASPANRTTAGADGSARNVRRLRPLRVLFASRDRRFLRVTAFLLERRGYGVIKGGGANIAETAAACRADVVLFESGNSRASTARILAALEALPSPPGVIAIYSGDPVDRLPGLTTLAKWAPVDDLARQIDSVSLRRGQASLPQSTRSLYL